MRAALTEIQRIPTSGARAVAAFTVGGRQLLAIPQLARDAPGSPPGMNGGDSDTELLLLQSAGGRFEPWSALPAPGGEDAEFFTIGGRSFLAVASIRTGSGPYELAAESQIFAWDRDRFVPFQSVATFAAKQWKHWHIGERHFLGLAQGVVRPGDEDRNRDSVVYEWDGTSFTPQQQIPSRWAYNWHPFRIGDEFFVAHADHAGESVLYRWDGTKLRPHQALAAAGGRAFTTFDDGGTTYLVVACISAPTTVMRWDGDQFTPVQTLDGLGGRELAVMRTDGHLLVIRINPGLTIVATFALALVAEACISLVWGPNPAASTPGYFNQAFRLGSLVVPRAQFYACLLAVGVTVALQAVVRRSWLGHAITAASENPEGARLVGVRPVRVGAWIFAIATATSAFGGAALSFLYQFTPDSQDLWIGLTLSVVILGGLGSIPGAFAAGLLLGVAEAVTSTYISVRWSAAVPTLLILVVLLIRPQGLFTRAARPDAAT